MKRTVSGSAGRLAGDRTLRSGTLQPIVIGHRGAAGLAPENTLASFGAALDTGAEWVEFDVRFTRDGEPVVVHDETLDRTTNGAGKVIDSTLADLSGLDAGGWFDERFTGERLPTLGQVLALVSGRAGVNIEVKDCGAGNVQAAVSRILAEVRNARIEPILVSSFEEPVVSEVVRQGLSAGLLARRWVRDPVGRAVACGARTVVLSVRKATPRRAVLAHEAGLSAWIYTVNERTEFDRAVAMGYDAVIGDRPDLLLSWRAGVER